MSFRINICTYPLMNLDHETTSIVIVVKLYLAIDIEAMLCTAKYHFMCTSCEFKLLEKQ